MPFCRLQGPLWRVAREESHPGLVGKASIMTRSERRAVVDPTTASTETSTASRRQRRSGGTFPIHISTANRLPQALDKEG